jgi:hypothetical protein
VDDRNPTGYSQVLEDLNGNSVQTTYTYGPNLLSEKQGASVYVYRHDGQASVRFLADAGGTIADVYDCD